MADAFAELKNLMAIGGLPDLGPGPREGVLPLATLGAKLDAILEKSTLPAESQELVRGLILLWHDHADAAHMIAQEIETADGSLLHGILHRREPDYGNAAYWFRRVGQHPSFLTLAEQVGKLLTANGQTSLQRTLMPDGKWDPFAFIKECEKAAGANSNNSTAELLRQIQGIELRILLDHFLAA